MALGAIPLTEVLAYMEMFSILDEDERRTLLRYVQALDRVLLEHARSEKPGEKGSTPDEPVRERRRGRR